LNFAQNVSGLPLVSLGACFEEGIGSVVCRGRVAF
jgi:hypothetical protein